MSRVLKFNLALPETSFCPPVPNQQLVHQRKLQQQSSQKYYYDRSARDLDPLTPGDKVVYKQDLADPEWREGAVVRLSQNPRSYVVRDDQTGGEYLRNRRFIMKPIRFRD